MHHKLDPSRSQTEHATTLSSRPRMRAPRTHHERDIQNAIRIALTRRDDIVLWRNAMGFVSRGDRKQRFGLCVGSADLIGILRLPSGSGIFLAIEVKREDGALSSEQALFLALVQKMGGIAILARSVEEAATAIDDVIARAKALAR